MGWAGRSQMQLSAPRIRPCYGLDSESDDARALAIKFALPDEVFFPRYVHSLYVSFFSCNR